jgi:hypothetical protein
MAAITNQTGSRKQQAMQRAESLTDIWDVTKAWLGRAAEIVLTICMFAQLIGMLPGVNYPGPVNNIILGVQIIMLDFGAFALAPLAEHARNIGQDDAAKQAENMATFLIRLVIFTMLIIIIGQFSPIFGEYAKYITGFVKYAEPALILVRVGCVVKYIHVIHSLRSSTTLDIQPTSAPTSLVQNERIDQLEDTIKKLNERLTSIMQHRQNVESVDQPTLLPTFSTSISEASEQIDIPMIEGKSEAAIEAVVVQYPVVFGVSDRKVKELIDAFLNGTRWVDMKGNYSQTVKPVREAYENLHPECR